MKKTKYNPAQALFAFMSEEFADVVEAIKKIPSGFRQVASEAKKYVLSLLEEFITVAPVLVEKLTRKQAYLLKFLGV